MEPHRLTVDDVLMLRASIKWRIAVTLPDSLPRIVYNPSEEAYALHHDGHIQCQHADITVLAALLRGERAERGFIHRVVSASEPPDAATLAPDAYAARRAAQGAEAARIRLWADEQAALARRDAELRQPNVANLSLDDL